MIEREDVEVVVMETDDVEDVVAIVVVVVINFNYFLISSFGMHFINENGKWILFLKHYKNSIKKSSSSKVTTNSRWL